MFLLYAVPRPWVVPAASYFSPPGFLSLTFLHLEDVSVAELLAQARDETRYESIQHKLNQRQDLTWKIPLKWREKLWATASNNITIFWVVVHCSRFTIDHLQPVLGVAGDLHRADPCRQRHLHVRKRTTVRVPSSSSNARGQQKHMERGRSWRRFVVECLRLRTYRTVRSGDQHHGAGPALRSRTTCWGPWSRSFAANNDEEEWTRGHSHTERRWQSRGWNGRVAPVASSLT